MAERENGERAGPPAAPGLKLRIEQKLGILGELKLVAYRGYGTPRSLHLKGRLIEAKSERGAPGGEAGRLHNILTTLRRMNSDEIPGARIKARFREHEHELYTDQEGYFQLNLYLEDELEGGWHEVRFDLVDSLKPDAKASARAAALVPSREAEFLVVSDLDDTVIQSSATSKITMARLTLLKSAEERAPFPGVSALYRALVRGRGEKDVNPIFYLSRSGWNLYDLFVDFFDAHGIPPGPMFLRDLAIREAKSAALGSEYHKLERIRGLLRQYPDLPFVLVGDTGQHDAARYRQLAIENPGRVRAVYLRDVTGPARHRELQAVAEDLRRRGVPTAFGEDTPAFVDEMLAEGLISPGAAEDIRRTAAADRRG